MAKAVPEKSNDEGIMARIKEFFGFGSTQEKVKSPKRS